MPIASIKSQWPVKTQTQTIARDNANETSSAAVNLPQTPNEILEKIQIVISEILHQIMIIQLAFCMNESLYLTEMKNR